VKLLPTNSMDFSGCAAALVAAVASVCCAQAEVAASANSKTVLASIPAFNAHPRVIAPTERTLVI